MTSNSATFSAQINPRGENTEYRFEYGPTNAYGTSVPAPDSSVGSGFETQEVAIHPQALLSHTTYHFRVVAHNALGIGYGEDHALVTQSMGGELTLPDGRMWEMVSPPSKNGALIYPLGAGLFEALNVQAAANGDAIAFMTNAPTEASPQGSANGVSIISTRGVGGWSSQVLAPPHREGTGPSVGKGGEYRFFSENLSLGIVQVQGNFDPLAPEVTEQTPYIRTVFQQEDVNKHCQTSCYQPLVTAVNTPPGTKLDAGEVNGHCEHFICGPYFLGATPDLSHIVLASEGSALTSTPDEYGLYEWAAGQLQLLSVLPQAEGGGAISGGFLGQNNNAARHAISSDGSRIIWSSRQEGEALYLRDTAKRETIRLDLPQANATGESSQPMFMTANSNDSRIFFLDSGRLTRDSTAIQEKKDLYEYDLNAPLGSRLTDLTVNGNAGEAADVYQVLGASEDGSYVYFAAGGALGPGASPGGCGYNAAFFSTMCNLYERHNGKTTFIAAGAPGDYPSWSQSLDNLTARVSPNGRWLAFQSQRNLTGYDTRDAVSGAPDEEVYLYDGEAGKLTCASCDPTGARPVGSPYTSLSLVGADRLWEQGQWLASELPPWSRFNLTEARYQSRYLSDSGRLFFDSHDALVPQDVNGTQDVYEYEPAGIGDCTQTQQSFSERSGGCLRLISSGTSEQESAFMDASETGGDVFFLTSAKLLPQDFDGAIDLYDAHECALQAPCYSSTPTSPPPCDTGDSCKPAPSPQPTIFGAPSSATFSGAGNVNAAPAKSKVGRRSLTRSQKLARALRACRRKSRRRQQAGCELRARKQYGGKAAYNGKMSTRNASAGIGR